MVDGGSVTVPRGYCQCGCGQKTSISKRNRSGVRKGEPTRFTPGHNGLSPQPFSQEPHTVEDRGYQTPCWVWQRADNGKGYGRLQAAGRFVYAHRYYYEFHKGPIPEALEIDHLCAPWGGPRRCVNPDHLEAVSGAINLRRGRGTRLTAEDVAAIRERYAEGGISRRELADLYGISQSQIGSVVRGENWRD